MRDAFVKRSAWGEYYSTAQADLYIQQCIAWLEIVVNSSVNHFPAGMCWLALIRAIACGRERGHDAYYLAWRHRHALKLHRSASIKVKRGILTARKCKPIEVVALQNEGVRA